MTSSNAKKQTEKTPAVLAGAAFVLVVVFGLVLILYADGSNTGFVYGNV